MSSLAQKNAAIYCLTELASACDGNTNSPSLISIIDSSKLPVQSK